MTNAQNSVDRDDRAKAIAWLEQNLVTDANTLQQLDRFVGMLLEEAENQNLIARATQPIIWTRHIIDSAQLLLHVPRGTSSRWIDLGSGAGLPGLVNAILDPASHFTLVERRPLRTGWLQRAASELGLDNVTVFTGPASAVPDQIFDVITARAFAPMLKLVELAKRFASGTTLWILPKGRSAADELGAVPGWQSMFHVEPSVTDDESGIIVGRLGQAGSRSKGGVRR